MKWEPDELQGNGGEVSLRTQGEHCLILKQALLLNGKEGQVNVVEAKTAGYKDEIVIPILALEAGKQSHVAMDLSFPDPPVTFKLIEGSGPVHIIGVHAISTHEQYLQEADDDSGKFFLKFFTFSMLNLIGEEDIDEEEEDEEEEEVAEPEKPKGKGKKRANSNSGTAPSKKKKNGKESP